MSGTSVSGDRYNFGKSGTLRNRFAGTNSLGMAKFTAMPNGYLAPYAWSLPQTSGGLATYKSISASIVTSSSSLAAGINMISSISGSFTLSNAQLDQIVSLIASISASSSITNAQLAAVAGIQASITASMSITNAELGAIVDLVASLSASISSSLGVFATANMESSIGGATPLSPEGLTSELLDNQDIETGYSLRESLRLMLASLAGKLSGAGTSVVSIRDINDSVDRIIATVDSNGNRTAVIKDVD